MRVLFAAAFPMLFVFRIKRLAVQHTTNFMESDLLVLAVPFFRI